MAARKVNTPGATEKAPTTAEQADAALEHITGQDAESQDQSTDALVPVEQLDAVAQKLAEAEAKIKALEAQSKAQVKTAATAQSIQSQAEVKRVQNVLTDHGWDSVEE
ncbi:hypothetical protein [Acinetobacter pseudolwoffii]|uniref:hypothetical protein n=1 Tax=Acinetobacter pseudolwoffii TaxID=2053287 RepID=UPI00246942A5|nr:hypothetical protein [Acinetobacter pseudolwoffii]MDH5818989.1 hypothetical protein [Acinetobacter pseudolwoffii]